MPALSADRLSVLSDAPVAPERDYVLYWQIMARRTRYNLALEHALDHAARLGRPLVVLEALRAGYPHASDRLHRWAIDGMADNAAAYARAGVAHLAYVEPEPGAGRGLLEALAAGACVVVTDEFPEYFLPRMTAAAGRALARVGARLEAVDGNGLLPLRCAGKAHVYAHQFRRFVQHQAPWQLGLFPAAEPLATARRLPALGGEAERRLGAVRARWAPAPPALLEGGNAGAPLLAALPIDHAVPPVPFRGGPRKAAAVLDDFFSAKYERYAAERNEPEDPANSGFSPYLHWGFLSAHEVFARVAEAEDWTPDRVAPKPTGKREGWWGMSANGEAFLEELVTWRELSYNTAFYVDRHDAFESLPPWAQATLSEHAGDRRAELFSFGELEDGGSYDALWNATQGQLRADGRIHNYLRILWGKKFLEWTRDPREALEFMLAMNNKWALDGRNPNSTSGITWVMGRYDRPWGPERPVIGKVRPMSSEATARKIAVGAYIERYGAVLPARAGSRADAGAARGEAPAPRGERRLPRDRGPARGAGTSGEDVLPPD